MKNLFALFAGTAPFLAQTPGPLAPDLPHTKSIMDVIIKAGPVMIPLFILSVIFVMLVIVYILTIRRGAVVSSGFMATADALLRKRDYLGLLAVSNRHGEAIARGLARQLDLGLAEPWQSARDPLIGFASLLTLLTGTLGKIGADVALLAQNEIGAVTIAGGGGSSSMAHKSNPVNAEVLVALARYNAGLIGVLQQSMVHENERSGAAWTLEWLALPPIAITAGASLRLGNLVLGQLSFPTP